MPSTTDLLLRLPLQGELTVEDRAAASKAAILKLWERGRLSTRAAASSLGLTYRGFPDRLDELGIPAIQGEGVNREAIGAVLADAVPEGPRM